MLGILDHDRAITMIVDDTDRPPPTPPPPPPDTSVCGACTRVVTGCAPDVKVVTPMGVLCWDCSRTSAFLKG